MRAAQRQLALSRSATGEGELAAGFNRQMQRLAAAERAFSEMRDQLRAKGIDPDHVMTPFAVIRDSLAEAHECYSRSRKMLALARYERSRARIEHLEALSLEEVPDPVIPDVLGLDMCPKADNVQTAADLMEALRLYHIWAGKPSYRTMERQCGRRFAASTICTALRSNKLPSLDLVQAVIAACGGTEEHKKAFASAWRSTGAPPTRGSACRPTPAGLVPRQRIRLTSHRANRQSRCAAGKAWSARFPTSSPRARAE